MKIKEIKSQNRRDFTAVYECEHCGHTMTGYGYDDANFHNNVIPKMKCYECGEASPDSYSPNATRYPEGFTV
jgi:primosomal protein N'